MSVSVRVNMIQPKNDQDRFTAERVLRTRPKTYRAIVLLLADPDAAVMHIAKRHRVSEHTVRAIRAREAQAIAERKQRLMSIFANVAEISGERMEELAGQANLRDAGITAGIATDKLLALTRDSIQNVHHLHSIDLSDDDLVAYAVALSHPDERQLLESIGFEGFMLAREKLKQLQTKQAKATVVENPSARGRNAAQKEN